MCVHKYIVVEEEAKPIPSIIKQIQILGEVLIALKPECLVIALHADMVTKVFAQGSWYPAHKHVEQQ